MTDDDRNDTWDQQGDLEWDYVQRHPGFKEIEDQRDIEAAERLSERYAYSKAILIERQAKDAIAAKLNAKNRTRSLAADERAAQVKKLKAQGLTDDEVAERVTIDGVPIDPRTVRRLRKRGE